MDHIWLIPVIAVVVWVISAVARGARAKERERERVEPMAQQPGPRRRPTSAEIDRFLEEVKRRQMEQRRRRETPVEAIPEVEPVVIAPSPRPQPPPVRRPPPRRSQSVEAVLASPFGVSQSIPVALPADSVSRVISQPLAAPVTEPRLTKAQAAQIAELRRMLQSPASLRAALILREVLGPPKSKQRRR